MNYNTQRAPIVLKAYGRGIQQLVAEALLTTERSQRQQKAQRIIEAMAIVSGQTQTSPEMLNKLWHHLAQMADYALDVDYPLPIERPEQGARPARVPYPTHHIRWRHYGHHLGSLMKQLAALPTAEQRAPIIRLAVARMRRNLTEMRSEQGYAERIAHDIALYTNDTVSAEEVKQALHRP